VEQLIKEEMNLIRMRRHLKWKKHRSFLGIPMVCGVIFPKPLFAQTQKLLHSTSFMLLLIVLVRFPV
jgi:hypothetical protein